MTDRLRLAAQAVLSEWSVEGDVPRELWDALRRALAEHADEPAPSNKCAHTSIIGVRDGMNWMERCYSCGKIMRQGGPTMTDFMVSPESIGPYLDAEPAPCGVCGGLLVDYPNAPGVFYCQGKCNESGAKASEEPK